MNMFWEGFTARFGWALGELVIGLAIGVVILVLVVVFEGLRWLQGKS